MLSLVNSHLSLSLSLSLSTPPPTKTITHQQKVNEVVGPNSTVEKTELNSQDLEVHCQGRERDIHP